MLYRSTSIVNTVRLKVQKIVQREERKRTEAVRTQKFIYLARTVCLALAAKTIILYLSLL